MKKIYQTLVEDFGYISEAPINATGYDPDQVQYAYKDGKPNPAAQPTPGPDTSDYTDPKGTDNVTNDPVKDKPKPVRSKSFDPNVQNIQKLFNRLGVTDNAGARLAEDGIWGWRTEEAKHNFYKKYKKGSAEERELQSYADKVAPQFQWRIIADRDGRTARGGADLSKPKDPAIGEPTPQAQKAMGVEVSPTDKKTGALPSNAENLILQSLSRLEPIFKKYGIQAECAYNDNGSILTEEDWVLKNINHFTPQEQMEIWRLLSEAPIQGDFKTKRQKADAKAAVKSAYQSSQQAAANYNAGATATAQNMPQQQSRLSKFGKNLAGRYGFGGGKKAAAKGMARLGLRAVPYIATAMLLWDVGSALYDTFATTEIADLDPADQQIIAQEIKNLTQMSKSADYDSVSDETKKKVTAILNAANKLAQQEGEDQQIASADQGKTSSGVTVSNW